MSAQYVVIRHTQANGFKVDSPFNTAWDAINHAQQIVADMKADGQIFRSEGGISPLDLDHAPDGDFSACHKFAMWAATDRDGWPVVQITTMHASARLVADWATMRLKIVRSGFEYWREQAYKPVQVYGHDS